MEEELKRKENEINKLKKFVDIGLARCKVSDASDSIEKIRKALDKVAELWQLLHQLLDSEDSAHSLYDTEFQKHQTFAKDIKYWLGETQDNLKLKQQSAVAYHRCIDKLNFHKQYLVSAVRSHNLSLIKHFHSLLSNLCQTFEAQLRKTSDGEAYMNELRDTMRNALKQAEDLVSETISRFLPITKSMVDATKCLEKRELALAVVHWQRADYGMRALCEFNVSYHTLPSAVKLQELYRSTQARLEQVLGKEQLELLLSAYTFDVEEWLDAAAPLINTDVYVPVRASLQVATPAAPANLGSRPLFSSSDSFAAD